MEICLICVHSNITNKPDNVGLQKLKLLTFGNSEQVRKLAGCGLHYADGDSI